LNKKDPFWKQFFVNIIFNFEDEDAENEEDEEEEEEEVMFSIEEQLEMVVEYLRTEHTYCTFCGIR